jgi:hypothetical protein
VNWILNRGKALLVGGAVGETGTHSAACHPPSEGAAVVVHVAGAAAAHFAAPDDEGLVEQAALLQVGDESGERLIAGEGEFREGSAHLCRRVSVPQSPRPPGTPTDGTRMKRTPRSTRRRASKSFVPVLRVESVELTDGRIGGIPGKIEGFRCNGLPELPVNSAVSPKALSGATCCHGQLGIPCNRMRRSLRRTSSRHSGWSEGR